MNSRASSRPVRHPNRYLSQYLDHYAQPEAAMAAELDRGRHENVLVIPCYDETEAFLDDVLPANVSDLLIIVVVNAPDDAPSHAQERTLRLLSALSGARDQPLTVVPFARSRNVDLLVIDRVTATRVIPRRQGVGLARKVGADCALALMAAGRIQREWIFATDADVTLPDDYLHTAMPASGTVLFEFGHAASDPALRRRAELYELHLRYYVNRLAHAGSPYAFHTLGSTMAVHVNAYAKVRGYPRRNAAEDFYMLNKLAKVDPIQRLRTPRITIHARLSDRVPFGTGPALQRIPERQDTYLSYADASFELLQDVLNGISAVAADDSWPESREVDSVLDGLGFFQELHRARQQQRDARTLRRALLQWFDGFRTLRFVHECRRFHSDAPLLDTLARLLGPTKLAPAATRRHFLEQLTRLENRTPVGLQ